MDRSKIVTIVPAFNEEKTIFEVIKNLQKFTDVIVVDDCSTDKTNNLINKLKIVTVKNLKNEGYEKSIYFGLLKARSLNYDYAITFDADGQHKAEDIKKFIEKIELGYDLILGNRLRVDRLSEKLGKILFFKSWGIKDPFCGFKCYKLDKFSDFNYFERYASVGIDLSLSYIRNNFKFVSIDIEIFKRDGKSKFGNILKGNYKIFKSIFLSYFYH